MTAFLIDDSGEAELDGKCRDGVEAANLILSAEVFTFCFLCLDWARLSDWLSKDASSSLLQRGMLTSIEPVTRTPGGHHSGLIARRKHH